MVPVFVASQIQKNSVTFHRLKSSFNLASCKVNSANWALACRWRPSLNGRKELQLRNRRRQQSANGIYCTSRPCESHIRTESYRIPQPSQLKDDTRYPQYRWKDACGKIWFSRYASNRMSMSGKRTNIVATIKLPLFLKLKGSKIYLFVEHCTDFPFREKFISSCQGLLPNFGVHSSSLPLPASDNSLVPKFGLSRLATWTYKK